MSRRPELLVPASSLEVLEGWRSATAPMPYISAVRPFGLRAKAKNFSMEDMREGIQFAHDHNVRVHVTRQYSWPTTEIFPVCEAYFKELKEMRPRCAHHLLILAFL